jgi:hypothetical protein
MTDLSWTGFIGYRFLDGFLGIMRRLQRHYGAGDRLRIKPGFVGKVDDLAVGAPGDRQGAGDASPLR